jgi:hypothetical protein
MKEVALYTVCGLVHLRRQEYPTRQKASADYVSYTVIAAASLW